MLFRCKSCRSAYLDPRPTHDSIGLAYQNYFTHKVASDMQPSSGLLLGYLKAGIRNDYLKARFGMMLSPRFPLGRLALSLLPYRRMALDRSLRNLALPSKNAKLLDIGCGSGDFIRAASLLGWDTQGIDPDPNAVAAARKLDLTVHQGGFPRTGFQDGQFDAVTLSHVIEHVHDPIVALREVHRILKPGGRIWMATPNLDSAGHHLFGRHWRGLEPPRHLVMFNASSLRLACERGGFEKAVLERSPPTAVWYFQASYRILHNQDPTQLEGEMLPWALAWRARWTDVKEIVMPKQGEELTMIATKS
jgi:2-polyprenyl-3-methyl-5-hydroxy-6-metoxy-1,4-benzoquinol methylase